MNLLLWAIYKKDKESDFSNYRQISLVPTTYKMSSNILFSKLSQHVDKIIGVIDVYFDVLLVIDQSIK
jgi:hypothetical protein